ncbi:MAG: autotransporter-associated beta strand repeat-containing protein [Akkermansiaceae bacterium]|nr:autotransporter-associated beta strand repeat-containing protein [Akkermansiaceae bacterium]
MKPKFQKFRLIAGTTLSSIVVISFASLASVEADTAWTGNALSSDMTNPANFDNGLPGAGNGSLFINNISNAIPVLTADLTLGWDLNISTGANTTGRLDHHSGTFSTGNNNWIIMGFNNGTGPANATYNLALTSGTGGTFTNFAQGSGSIANFGKINLGWDANTTSTMNVNTSGTITGGEIEIGSTGGGPTSTFNIDNGAVNLTGSFEVGGNQWSNQGGSSFFNMSGGSITTGGEFWGGGNGATTAVQSGGSITSGAWFVVGRGGTNVATYTMSGNASVTAATSTVGSFAVVGSFAGSQGTLEVGGNATFQTGGNRKMFIGEGGTGTLDLVDNGHVTVNNNVTGDGFRLGVLAGSSGTVNLDGGTLEVAYIAKGAGSGTFNFNGGTLKIAGNHDGSNTFMSGLTAANVKSAGAVIDPNGRDGTINQPLLEDGISTGGGLTVQGASGGSVTLGGVNTYTGATSIDGATLAVDFSGSIDNTPSVTVTGGGGFAMSGTLPSSIPVAINDGSVDGAGQISGTVTVADLSTNTVSAGNGGLGDLTVDTLVFDGDAKLDLQATGDTMDQVVLINTALTTTPANGVISVDVTNTAGLWTGDPGGWQYDLIDHAGGYSGTVATDFVIGTLTPALAPGQTASIEDIGGTIVLVITGDPLEWTGGVSADWNTSENNWQNTGGATSYSVGQSVLFDDGASELIVNLAENVEPGLVQFSNFLDDYVISSSGGFGINGGASLVIDNGGKVTIETDNSYTGSTTITDGALVLTGNGSINDSSSINVGLLGELVFESTGSVEYGNPITGAGNVSPFVGSAAITKRGTGTLTLSGANTFTADFALEAGQLNLNSAGALGAGPGIFIITGGILDNTSGGTVNLAPNKAVDLNADLSFIGTNDLYLSNGVVTPDADRTIEIQSGIFGMGAINDAGAGYSLTKTGAGKLVLNGSNIAGNLDIQTGIVGINQDLLCAAPIGAGILQNEGTVGNKWAFFTGNTDVTSAVQLRDKDPLAAHTFKLGLVKQGTGSLTLTNAANSTSGQLQVESGTLVLNAGVYARNAAGGGTFVNAPAASLVGSVAARDGVLVIDGATVDYDCSQNDGTQAWHQTLSVGTNATAAGAVKLVSGSLDTFRALDIGYAAGSYGGYTQTGGTATVGGFVVMGGFGSNAVFNQSSGTFIHNGPMTASANNAAGVGIIRLRGDAVYNCNNTSPFAFWIGENGRGELNIEDGAALTLANTGSGVTIGGFAGSSGVVNLLGGSLTAKQVVKGAGAGRLNFNGGSLVANAGSGAFLSGLDVAYVHSGGGTIDNGGNAITIGQGLQAPTGNGVSATGLTVSGGGYIDTPVVTITGGGGTGATAVAEIDANGDLSAIVITNPGVNYTSAPTFTLTGGGANATGAVGGTATLVPNVSGGMLFTGGGTTTLTGVNRYKGGSVVDAGTSVTVTFGGEITVAPTANTVTSKVAGAGNVTFQGKLRVDATGADITDGNSWHVVDVAGTTYDSSFGVSIAGVLDLTPQGDGVTHIGVDGANTWTYSETTGVLSLSIAAGGGYGTWITGFGLDPADQDPTDNPDNDTLSNLGEYYIGRDPSQSDGAASTVSKSGTDLIVTFTRSDLAVANGDVTGILSYGSDLAGWTDVVVPAASGTVGGVSFVITDGSPNDTVVATIPTGGAPEFFGRVKVEN